MNITVHLMITDPELGLGYCCEWGFFTCWKRTSVIASRLGVTNRAIQKHKAAVRDCGQCENKPNCLKAKGALVGKRALR